MFASLKEQPKDKILALMEAYAADTRDNKVDLGVGVYKNGRGETPVMRAVKTAEKRLWDEQTTKKYTGLPGDPTFNTEMRKLILGGVVSDDRLASIGTPGGTGAVRQAFELFKAASTGTIWMSDPTWPNHPAISDAMDLPRKSYRYFDAATGTVTVDGMIEDLKAAKAGDLVLLHGCCHNPTGANLTEADWARVIEVLKETGATPMIDIAYQGFGDGLEADGVGVRLLAAALPEMLIAGSCSKNFGIYRERTGILIAIAAEAGDQGRLQGMLNALNRANYSFPPDHGAKVVGMILSDPELRADWEAELEEVRLGMLELRQQLADELRRLTNSDTFDFVAEHRGMFSRLGLDPETVAKLREEHGIYMVGDSRINIAGLNTETVPLLAQAIAAVRG